MQIFVTGNGKIKLGNALSRARSGSHGGCLDDSRSGYCGVHGKKDWLRTVIYSPRM